MRSTDADLSNAPPHIAGDYPEWLDPHLAKVFGEARVEEGAALSSRAPLDLRVNTLKGSRDEAVGTDARSRRASPRAGRPIGLRIEQKAEAKNPAIHAEPAFIKGLIEIQDEGSQLAALFAGAKAGEQVVDLCAGAGGKTLALAAAMDNKGQIFATDTDKRRLAPIHARLERAGARNVQVRTPERSGNELEDLKGQIDLVLIDAPCTGTGSWRRNPDAKWRLRPGALEIRRKEQVTVLERARAACSRPAAASPTSPVRCWTRRTARRCAISSSAIRNFQSRSRPRSRRRSASAACCSSARC